MTGSEGPAERLEPSPANQTPSAVTVWLSRGAVLVALFGVCLVISLLESWMVHPAPSAREGDWSPDLAFEDVHFTSLDGVRLHGWLLAHPNPAFWILYCHGNGTHVAFTAKGLSRLREDLGASIFVFDYRGYGRSQGRPTERGVLADGEAALQWLCRQARLPASELILYGRSLGGGVVIDLAARHQPKAIVVERTFTRLTDVAARHFPFLPVRWLMRNRYDNIDKIPRYGGPVLLSHATHDEFVPLEHGTRLFDAVPHPAKRFYPIEGATHNDPNPKEYEQVLREFLRQSRLSEGQ
jgi:fermentation-respiration switch protein FrsA (DUF1100 family)